MWITFFNPYDFYILWESAVLLYLHIINVNIYGAV